MINVSNRNSLLPQATEEQMGENINIQTGAL